MKPIKLVMSAFGPYGNETEIDFEKLSDTGIFLITGDTGAGKTTIFDAISFALYGEASGGTQRRASKTFRSDFAAEATPTFVEFTFRQKNRTYTVRRNPEYQRPKKRGTGTIKEAHDARLFCEETNELTEGLDAVAKKVSEIIGLTRNQFAQTVMIPQGDFLKILNAKSDERKKLFQKIFHTDVFSDIQSLLKEMEKECSDANRQSEADISAVVSRIEKEEGFSGNEEFEEIRRESKYALRVSEFLSGVLVFQNEKRKSFKEEARKAEDIYEKSIKAEEEAKRINALFDDKRKLLEKTDKLLSRGNEIEEKKRMAAEGRKAAAVREPLLLLRQTVKEEEKQKERYEKAVKSLEEAKEKLSYVNAAYEKAGEESKMLDAYKAELNTVKDALPALTRFEELSEETEKAEKLLLAAYEKSTASEKEYLRVKALFFAGQSALIAQELKEGEKCPVCGSTHHPSPAKPSESTVTRKQYERCEEERDRDAKCVNEAEKAAGSLRVRKEEALSLLEKYGIHKKTDKSRLEKSKKKLESAISGIEKRLEDTAEKKKKAEALYEGLRAGAEMLAENVKRLEKEKQKHEKAYVKARSAAGFADEASYLRAAISETEIRKYELEATAYTAELRSAEDAARVLEKQTAGKEPVNLSEAHELTVKSKKQREIFSEMLTGLENRISENRRCKNGLERLLAKKQADDERWALVKELYNNVSGQTTSRVKLSFEAYVQQFYFKQVIAAANKRLTVLTDGRFTLRCKEEAKNLVSQSGLDLDVLDRSTGFWRDVSTLSGGESFMTSLALALGLSDTAQAGSGGVRLDSMFIDEGFGSLDEDSLHQAMGMLSNLADGKRMIGIISHVSGLKSRIDKKIVVRKTLSGSKIEIEA